MLPFNWATSFRNLCRSIALERLVELSSAE